LRYSGNFAPKKLDVTSTSPSTGNQFQEGVPETLESGGQQPDLGAFIPRGINRGKESCTNLWRSQVAIGNDGRAIEIKMTHVSILDEGRAKVSPTIYEITRLEEGSLQKSPPDRTLRLLQRLPND